MHLELKESEEWKGKTAAINLAIADESVLRYRTFLGDLILRVGEVDFSTRWGWIPLLDLAYCIKEMIGELLSGQPAAVFEFTESDAILRLVRHGQNVVISASYVDGNASVDLQVFSKTAISVSRRFFEWAAQANTDLASNPHFLLMWEEVRRDPTMITRPDGLKM
jgi:hypothetical protein